MACDATTFRLTDDPPTVRGTCGNYSVFYPLGKTPNYCPLTIVRLQADIIALETLILSQRGVLTCGGASRGTPSATLDETCCDVALDTAFGDERRLMAVCLTDRFRRPDCGNRGDAGGWRESSISLNGCRGQAPAGRAMMGAMADCRMELVEGRRGFVLSARCSSMSWNVSLGGCCYSCDLCTGCLLTSNS